MFWVDGLPMKVTLKDGTPQRLTWKGQSHQVQIVSVRWRIHTAWWREKEIWRDYWELATADGYLCHVYEDMNSHSWYLERIFE
jgi:hypothetical protein